MHLSLRYKYTQKGINVHQWRDSGCFKEKKLKLLRTCWLAELNSRHKWLGTCRRSLHPPPPLTGSGRRWRQCLRSAAAYLHQSSQLDREEKESPAQPCQWVRETNPGEGLQRRGELSRGNRTGRRTAFLSFASLQKEHRLTREMHGILL